METVVSPSAALRRSEKTLSDAASNTTITAVIVGNVDDGKSTFLGRLLAETGNLLPERLQAIEASCQRRKIPFEWSFILDAFQLERDQGITIDTTELMIKLPDTHLHLIDAPGHLDFIQNMITGASKTQNALIVIDAARGIQPQTKRHLFILRLLGVTHVVVLFNKMDKVDYQQARYNELVAELQQFGLKIDFQGMACIPIAASLGKNICTLANEMPWYTGPTCLEAIVELPEQHTQTSALTLFEIQTIQRTQTQRIIHAHLISGSLHIGQPLHFYPSGKTSTLKSLNTWPTPLTQVSAPSTIAFEINDDLFLNRGNIGSDSAMHFQSKKSLEVILYWFGAEPNPDAKLIFKLGVQQSQIVSMQMGCKIDIEQLETLPAHALEAHQLFRCTLLLEQAISYDKAETKTALLGCPIVCDAQGFPLAVAHITTPSDAFRHLRLAQLTTEHLISTERRTQQQKHQGHVFWLTGLSGAGKTTLAMLAEEQLFNAGYRVYVLDGDNLRSGLNKDLGFTEADRKENIRRTAEVAKLFAALGYVVVVSLITPYESDRTLAKTLCADGFSLIYINTLLATCEGRDSKKLYAKARQGLIQHFTGINAPFEEPSAPDLEITNDNNASIAQNVDLLCHFIRSRLNAHTSLY